MENIIKPLFASKPNSTMENYLMQKVIKYCGGYICNNQMSVKIEPSATLKYLQHCISQSNLKTCNLIK